MVKCNTNRKKRIATVSVLLIFLSGLLSAQEIRLPESPDAAVKSAGEELRAYAGKILNGKKSSAVFRLAVDNKLDFEEWQILSVDDGVKLSGGSGRGILYAVYHYLEDCCGVRFLSGDAEHVPPLAELPVRNLNLRGKPAFRVRCLGTLFPKDNGRFSAKRRINFQGWDRIAPEYGGSSGEGRPAPCHTFAYYVPYAKYRKTHPEYFSLTKDGKRTGGQTDGQLCLSNPEVRRIMLMRLREFIRLDRETTLHNHTPPPTIYDVSQNDNQKFCICNDCKALAAKYGGTQSGVMLELVNELADGIREQYPDVVLSTFAYQYTEQEPENIKARPNVRIRLCDTRGNQTMPLEDTSNAFVRARLENWRKIAKLSFWDYGDNFDAPYNLPVASEYTFQPDYRFLRQYCDIVKCEIHVADPDAREYKYYLLSKFMENPDSDFKKESAEFAELYYGKAGKLFLEYRELLHDSAMARKSFVPMYPYTSGLFAYLDLNTVRKAYELFDRGEDLLAGDPIRLERWNIARMGLDRAILVRSLHLTHAWRAGGGKASTFPFDFQSILRRVRRVNLDYAEKYIVKPAISPNRMKNAAKTVDRIKNYYARIEKNLFLPETAYQPPDKWKQYPTGQIYFFYPPQMRCRAKGIVEIDDPTALTGRSIRIYHSEKMPVKPFACPLQGEVFNYDRWKGTGCGQVRADMLTEPGWQWVRLGRISRLGSSGVLVFPSWGLLIGIADACSEKGLNVFDCWLHLKGEGKAYRRNATEKINALYLDAVVLIRKKAQ